MMQLVVERGEPAGHAWPLAAGITSIGRGADNDITVPGGQVSRVHCLIELSGQDYILTDKSTNGTFVNGRRVPERTVLKAGDRIQIGDFVLRCELSPEAGVTTPPPALPYGGFEPGPPAPEAGPALPEQAAAPYRQTPTSNVIPIAIGIIGAIVILALVVTAALFLSRGRATPSTPTVAPTTAPQETVQPTVAASPEVTPTVTAQVQPTVSPVTAEGKVSAQPSLNVRSAPAANAAQLYALSDQSTVTVIGRNEAGDWYQIQCAAGQPADRKCWVAASYVQLTQPNVQLPVVQP
jgi:hypothetical protein